MRALLRAVRRPAGADQTLVLVAALSWLLAARLPWNHVVLAHAADTQFVTAYVTPGASAALGGLVLALLPTALWVTTFWERRLAVAALPLVAILLAQRWSAAPAYDEAIRPSSGFYLAIVAVLIAALASLQTLRALRRVREPAAG